MTTGPAPAAEPRVPDDELEFRLSRSGGPGGQNVNKTETRVEALWNVTRARRLSAEERERVLARLAGRIDKQGVLRVVASSERSQLRNRELAVERLRALVEEALRVPKKRKKRGVPRAAKERRIEGKRRRGAVKAVRRSRPED